MRRSSRGTPGVKKKRALPISTAKPQAVPIGLSMTSAVAGGRAPAHGETEILELLADIGEIAVDDLAGQHLVAGADDLDLHACSRHPRGCAVARPILHRIGGR